MLVQSVMQDVRFAVRQLRRSMGFSLTVMLTVALGVAAATAVFSLVHAVLLTPLPYPHPERLMALQTLESSSTRTGSVAVATESTSYPNFFDWRRQSKSFASIASYSTGGMVLGAESNTRARRVPGVQVSGDFFDVLGVAPELGRGFTRAEEQPGTRTVVLSHDTWQTEFGGDKNVLGKSITLSDEKFTIVGVMPKGFYFPTDHADTALWITMARDGEGKNPSTQQRGYNQLDIVGRLRDGVSVEQAKAELDTIQEGLALRYPDEDKTETGVSVVPELKNVVADVQLPLTILFCAVCCLLMIVCVNVAGLLLSRMSRRRGEIGVRVALGASRRQVLRQLLTESVLLSVCGGALGLGLTAVVLKAAPQLLPANLPRVENIALDGPVAVFAIAVSVLTGLLFGVLPAWKVTDHDPATMLAENSRGTTAGRRQFRLQNMLVVGETAIGLVLLVGAGLLVRSFDKILRVDPGFNPQHMLTFRLAAPGKRYDEAKRVAFTRELIGRLRGMPGVQAVSAAFPLPLTQGNIGITFSIAGRPMAPGDEPAARVSLVHAGLFETLQIPLKRGRLFLPAEHDEKGVPVVIVNEAFAQKFFPGQDAVGQHIKPGLSVQEVPPMREIVGVVGNVKRANLTEEAEPEYYIPMEQAPVAMPSVAIRVQGDPMSYVSMARAQVAALDSGLPIYRVMSYEDDLARTSAQQRFQAMLLTGFAALALLLAAIGLYGALSYMVSQKTAEMGLRLALGAQRSNVLQMILWRGLGLAAAGLALGLVVAAGLSRFIAGLLYGTKPLDAITFAGMTAVLLVVSVVASVLPAYRASRLDPMETLRAQ